MTEHKASGRAVGATTLIRLAGLAPPTLHSLGVRLASQFSSHAYNVLVTNVPGPPRPLYAMGARMLDMYPVVPLAGGQAVSIGITSYDGGMHYGLNADRDALPDVDVLAESMPEALAELTEGRGRPVGRTAERPDRRVRAVLGSDQRRWRDWRVRGDSALRLVSESDPSRHQQVGDRWTRSSR